MSRVPFNRNRRAFLKGAGACLTLPYLASIAPKASRAQAGTVWRPRFFGMFVPNGINMDHWWPSAEGRNFALPSILEPLGPVRDQVLVLHGVDNFPATDQGDGAGDHARGTVTFLTATHPEKERIRVGQSFDQMLARAPGAMPTPFASLELGLETGSVVNACDSNYACAYQNNISWKDASTPMSKLINPRVVFDRLFGAGASLSAEERERRKRQDKSILDFVHLQARSLKRDLAVGDQHKLDAYMTSVREVEQRIDGLELNDRCEVPDQPAGVPIDFNDYADAMLDLALLAYRCDLTRVVTFMMANGGSNRTFPFLDVRRAHHELSHHQGIEEKLEGLRKINRWEVDKLAYVLGQLKRIEEPGPNGEMSTALDNTIAVLGSELEDGNAHRHTNIPVLLAGRGGGLLDTGRFLKLPEGTAMADIYVTLLRAMDIPRDRFGDDGVNTVDAILAG